MLELPAAPRARRSPSRGRRCRCRPRPRGCRPSSPGRPSIGAAAALPSGRLEVHDGAGRRNAPESSTTASLQPVRRPGIDAQHRPWARRAPPAAACGRSRRTPRWPPCRPPPSAPGAPRSRCDGATCALQRQARGALEQRRAGERRRRGRAGRRLEAARSSSSFSRIGGAVVARARRRATGPAPPPSSRGAWPGSGASSRASAARATGSW